MQKTQLKKTPKLLAVVAATFLASASLAFTQAASADYRDHYRDRDHRHDRDFKYDRKHDREYRYARVTHVEPVYRVVRRQVPVEQCWIESVERERSTSNHRSRRATLLGGLIGAAAGSKISHHHGDSHHLGALAGSIIGASIGHSAGKKHHGDRRVIEVRDVERCETTYHTKRKKRLVGYDVSYRLHGRIYRTHMKDHPGRKIKIAKYHSAKYDHPRHNNRRYKHY